MKKFFDWLRQNPVVPTLVILAGVWFAYDWWTTTPPPPQCVEERQVARPAEAPPAVVGPPQRALDPFTHQEGMIATAERSVESSAQLSYRDGWQDGQRSLGVRHLSEEEVLGIARRVVERERQRLREGAPPPMTSEEVPRPDGQLIDPGVGTRGLMREERRQVFYK